MKSFQDWERGMPSEAPQKWYTNEPKVGFSSKDKQKNKNLVAKYSAQAEELLSEEVLKHRNKKQAGNRYQNNWMTTIMSKGTLADKVAAQILQVQNSPVHSLSTLNNLVNMVRVGKKKECLQVIENLVELWLNDLLRPDHKLIPFESRPLDALEELDHSLRNKCLILWWFENKLKDHYTSFIRALDSIAKESIENIKGKAIGSMSQLLSSNPEQEQLILAQLVNKMGDPQQSVASKAIHYLQQVLRKHPNMQPVVLEEVEKMIFRPNIQSKAQYYAICFLIQFQLSPEDKKLASNMINLYFCLFKVCIKKGELDSRLLRILLSGVKRAFPYAKDSLSGTLSNHFDTLHKLVHVSSFGVALHALCLLHQVAQASSAIEDRFYNALYKKLIDPEVIKTKHLALFLNIVYKSICSDANASRVQAFLKRLLQIAEYSPSNLACSILYLVSQVIAKKKDLKLTKPQDNAGSSKDQDEESDDEEKYEDVKLDSEEKEMEKPKDTKPSTSWSWVVGKNVKKTKESSNEYEPFNRNPLFTNAELVGLRELTVLTNHYHPTVSLFAQNILNKQTIQYTGDILVDFSSSRFLDRFSFKNPKKETEKGRIFSRTSQYQPQGVKSLRVNSSRYMNVTEDAIPKEDVFLYRYMQKKFQSISEEKEEAANNSDNESVNSEEFEEMLFGKRKDIDEDEEGDEEEMDFAQEAAEDVSKKGKNKKKRKMVEMDDDEDLSDEDAGLPSDFASAEQFAEMLQSAGLDDADMGGSSAVRNTDNAHAKQLKWEQERERKGKGSFKRKQKMQPRAMKSKKRKA